MNLFQGSGFCLIAKDLSIPVDKRWISFERLTDTMNEDQDILMGKSFLIHTHEELADCWSGKVHHEIYIFMTETIEFLQV